MWYCKYFAIKMMFRCNRNKYSRANDSQEVNKTWLVLLGRVKTMKKSNYLIFFFRTNIRKLLSSFNNWKHRIGCSNSETLFESESLISWKMIGDGQLQNQFSPVQVAHHLIMMSSQNFLIMSFCDIEENTKEQNGGRSSVIWFFFRPLTLRRGSWGVAYNTHQRSEDLRKLKNVKSQKSPPNLKVEHQGWTIACSNEQTGKVDVF